eukprot:3523291-Rhodomonas_salina.2
MTAMLLGARYGMCGTNTMHMRTDLGEGAHDMLHASHLPHVLLLPRTTPQYHAYASSVQGKR